MGLAIYDEVDSTNSLLLRQAKEGVGEGAWALARRQTGGRGRQGREWTSLEGNLHASTLVLIRPEDPPAPSLALISAVALHRAICDSARIASDRLRIKWPNDLVALRGQAWSKIAGILLEREGPAVVIGFGANLAHAPNLPGRATACAADFGLPPKPTDLCLALEQRFAEELGRWRTRGPDDSRRRWLDRALPVGTRLTVHLSPDETISGSFEGLEPDGALRLRLDHGAVEVIRAGDVGLA